MTYPDVRTLLARHGLAAKKSWGQNFLLDRRVLERIAGAVGAGPDDTVVEIGAGLGHLTAVLSERAGRVVAVERDRDMAAVLRAELGDRENVELLEENALSVDLGALAARAGRRLLVVGNLPYHLSSQILVHLLDARAHLAALVLMFQKELAERIAAPPGSRDYGSLSVIAQVHADIHVALEVPRGAFHPRPQVKSTVLRFDLRSTPRAEIGDEARFRRVVHAAFGQRRKTVRNALLGGLQEPSERVDAALAAAGVAPTARAETLSAEVFAALARAL